MRTTFSVWKEPMMFRLNFRLLYYRSKSFLFRIYTHRGERVDSSSDYGSRFIFSGIVFACLMRRVFDVGYHVPLLLRLIIVVEKTKERSISIFLVGNAKKRKKERNVVVANAEVELCRIRDFLYWTTTPSRQGNIRTSIRNSPQE